MAEVFDQIDTFEFSEPLTGEQCVVVVCAGSPGVALTLSRQTDGDVEVVLPPGEVRQLIDALVAGLRHAE